jgi:hypothetical protein
MSRGCVKKVVFFGTTSSVFVVRTAEELRTRGTDVQIIDPYLASSRLAGKSGLRKLLRLCYRFWYTRQAIRQLDREQTVVIHSLGIELFWVSLLLKRHFKKVVGIAYGSDILRRRKRLDWFLSIGLKRLDCIAATNANVRDVITESFPSTAGKEALVIRFGLSVFDALENLRDVSPEEARIELGYVADKPLICLGYSASSGQRQQELIDFFAEQPGLHEKYQFVVPVQYGSSEVRLAVEQDCRRVNKMVGSELFRPLTLFQDPDTSALMRLATTVLINHSISDAFSGTVQETVYAGNMVLAGTHLPYSNMPGFGSAIKLYDSLSECVSALNSNSLLQWKCLTEAALTENRAELRKISSWDGVIDEWCNLIDSSV